MGIAYAANGDTKIAYETFGTAGEPLLLVLGLDYQMVWWHDAFCARLVEAGFHVARYDNRDTGLSTHFPAPAGTSPWRAALGGGRPAYTMADMVGDGLAVMDALGWAGAHVLGGTSAIAQAMALLHPERVRGLTLCMSAPATAGLLGTLRHLKFGIFREIRKLPRATTPQEKVEYLIATYRLQASPGYPFPEEWVREVATLSEQRAPYDPGTTQRHLAAGRATRLPPLSGITAPTLVVSGADDPMVKVSGGRALAAQIPGARFVLYPGVGHDLPEAIWDDMIARMPRAEAPA
ncbi:alpha/beta fold hydrolase [Actinoplanes sp. L3-i22]|uniref:alpha/beta fold hydrolase n=1 Tax=Actinoplanes sp. L3-i22 TaxID=2836373 RepID=UPI001C79489C|nr:alpha/beta fold hydrolase [Actinoplanes sp. L3-i22]BCY09928.1 alpha/beta hydrolase [Actinoplanes sp. L3-i22]